MKQARGTLILFLVVAVLGALTFWDFHSEEKKNKAELENTRIFPLDTEKIKSVSIRHGKDALKLSKDGQWRLETPVADAVDEPAVKDFLRDLTTERFQNVAREGEGIDWKIFGLDEPMATISVEESEGRKVSVLISAKKNFEGNSLIRIEGENRVLVAPFTLHSWATKKALDFRDRRILRADVSGVNEIIFSGKERLRLRLLEGQWKAEGRDVEIEASRVREFLNTLVNNKADEFALEGKATPAKRKELGLFRPVASIELGFSDRRWKADFFRGQDKINYAEVSDPAFILKVPAFLLTRFEEMDINAFRNLKKPFEFSRDSVQLVSWSKGGKKTTFKKHGEEWKLEPEDTTKKVDSSAVDQMLRNLRNAEAAFYVKAGEAKGLQSNSETLELMDGEGKLLFKLTWGGSFKRKSEGMEKSLFYARTNVSPEDIALEQSVIDRLELNNLTQPVPQEVKAEKAGP